MPSSRKRPPGGPAQGQDTPSTIGSRVQQLRADRELTQDDLAKAVKVSKSFMSEVENDHAVPGGEILLRLAETLGTSTDYILKGGSAPETSTAALPARRSATHCPGRFPRAAMRSRRCSAASTWAGWRAR